MTIRQQENQATRQAITDAGLKYWEVAEAVGVSPSTFTIWLRKPLDDDKKKRIDDALKELANIKKSLA